MSSCIKKIFLQLFIVSIFFNGVYANVETGFGYISKIIELKTWYYTKFNNTIYYFKINDISETVLSGEIFALTKSPYAQIEKFNIKVKNDIYLFHYRESTQELKGIVSLKNGNLITTFFYQQKSFLNFLNNLQKPITFVSKKYVSPEFNTYKQRYKEKIFENKISVLYDVVYGNAEGYWSSYPENSENSYLKILLKGLISAVKTKPLDLTMDIYYPSNDIDSVRLRPLIMFIHGGGFYIGDKQSEPIVKFCEYFASQGYVTASVNYRLGFIPSGEALERAGYRALQDANAAMRYLVNNSYKYGIDTRYLFVAGTSAGAITALNLAFMRNENRPKSTFKSALHEDMGDIESSGNDIRKQFNIKTVINMWGAVNDLGILENSNTAVISFHGNKDAVVPIDCDYPFKDIKANFSSVILNKVCGSLQIHMKLRELNRKEELYILENCGHSPYVDDNYKLNDKFWFITQKTTDFLYSELIPKCAYFQYYPYLSVNNKASILYNFKCNQSDIKSLTWKITGGLIIGIKDNSVRVVWFRDSPEHKLTASVLFDNGLNYIDEYKF